MGEGSMFDVSPPDVRLENLIEMFSQLDSKLQDCVLDHLKGLLKYHKEKE